MTKKKTENLFQRHEKDTGSPEFQIGTLTEEISLLQGHLQINPKDFDAKRSLLKKVAKRRRLLKYIKNQDLDSYSNVSKRVGVKV
ncbi:MAG: 30S ribosomal protein S15 [Candidatus Absconditabacterales bacterium]|nr:30S ribosomal protein S15 [Candidatus Absconditabacterales bacterium]